MTGKYSLKLLPASHSECSCCNGLTIHLTRQVYQNQHALAVYFATYSNNHPDNDVDLLLSLGESENQDPSVERVTFLCHIRPTSNSYQVMLGDADESPYSEGIAGRNLSRAVALMHPLKNLVFEMVDYAFMYDPSLLGFLRRVHCSSASVPLPKVFGAPDGLEWPKAQREDTWVANILFHDGNGCYCIRGALSIPVETYGFWRMGVWVEISRADFVTIENLGSSDNTMHNPIQLEGQLANIVDLPHIRLMLGEPVLVQLCRTEHEPIVTLAGSTRAKEMDCTWEKSSFENYAIQHGFL